MMPEKSTRLQAPRVPVWPSLKSRVALGAVAVLVLHALLAGFERRPDLPGVVSTCSLKLRRYLLIGRWWEGAVGDSAPARVDGV